MSVVESVVTAGLPKHARIKAALCGRIGKQWARGQRLPTVRQLAGDLDAGFGSVQRAVRELADAGVLISRRRSGTYVSPRADAAAVRRVLDEDSNDWARAPGGTLAGVKLVAVLDEAAHARLYAGLAATLLPKGCSIRVIPPRIPNDYRDLTRPEVEGVILMQPNSFPEIQVAPDQILTIVTTTPDVTVAARGRYDIVTTEHEQGAFLAGRRFRDLGIKTACFIGAGERHDTKQLDRTSAVRLRGFERGWGRTVSAAARLICETYDVSGPATVIDRYLSLSPRPEGVFAASDELGVGFVVAARAHGLQAPRDYQLIGFDGLDIGQKLNAGPLTTIWVHSEEMGKRAAELLERRLGDPDAPVHRLAVGCSLLQGATTRAFKEGSEA